MIFVASSYSPSIEKGNTLRIVESRTNSSLYSSNKLVRATSKAALSTEVIFIPAELPVNSDVMEASIPKDTENSFNPSCNS